MYGLWDPSGRKALCGVQDILTMHLLPFIPATCKKKKDKTVPSPCQTVLAADTESRP